MFFKSVQIRSKEPTFLDALASICLSLTEGMFGISSVVSRSLDGLVVNHDDPSPEWAGLSSRLNGLTQECSIFLSKQATIYNFMQNKMLEINLWKEKQNTGMMMEITVLKMRLVHVASICLILLEPVAPLFSDFFFLSQAGLTGLACIWAKGALNQTGVGIILSWNPKKIVKLGIC